MSKRTYSANAQASINRFSSIIRDLELARHAVIALLESISSPIGVASLAGTAMGTAGEMKGRAVFPIEAVWEAIRALHREGLIVLFRRSLTPLIEAKEVPVGEYPLDDQSQRWVDYTAKLRQHVPMTVGPTWDRATGELWIDGKLAKRIANLNQAENVVAILDAFQNAGWQNHIDDPLPMTYKLARQQRLGDALRSLKRNLQHIEFRRDGSGGIVWERASMTPP